VDSPEIGIGKRKIIEEVVVEKERKKVFNSWIYSTFSTDF